MRGDLVTIVAQGGYGKPRPALVIQADQYNELPGITVLPVTSTLVDAPLLRIKLTPSEANGLKKTSQVMVDKAITVRLDKMRPAFGSVSPEKLVEVERCLAVFLGIAR